MSYPFAAAFLAFLSLAAPASSQMAETYALPLPHDPKQWAETAALIRERGHSCPEVKSMVIVGQDPGGDNHRVECGAANGPADPMLVFRVRLGGEAGPRVEPWK